LEKRKSWVEPRFRLAQTRSEIFILFILMIENMIQNNLQNKRHSLAHLLAAAVLRLWPDVKNTLGPAIDNGFYYDFEFSTPISDKDFLKIEKKMRETLKDWKTFDEKEISAEEAYELFKDNPYKIELIDEIVAKGEKITIYTSGHFFDLCRGGHVKTLKQSI